VSLAKLPIITQTILVCDRCGKFIVFDEAVRSQRTGKKNTARRLCDQDAAQMPRGGSINDKSNKNGPGCRVSRTGPRDSQDVRARRQRR
jgi:hypothetical protein